MAWQSLKNQTDALPLVLAGPILRRTEQKAVTVWLALKEPRTVTLRVARKDIPDQAVLRSAPRAPIKLGQHLYVVAVTARPDTGTLDPGHIYLYDIDFGNGQTLMSPKVVTAQGGLSAQALVCYPGVGLPSFALPPANIQQLRLVHGSCRKPHGDCWDALSALDTILDLTYGNANARPHQLFLTGDQIYADDVADALLFMIHDRQSALGLTQESLPGIPSDPRMLLPGFRYEVATNHAGMSAALGDKHSTLMGKKEETWTVAKSHLLTFAEYNLMYLFTWSDVLWPSPGDFPTHDDVFTKVKGYPIEVSEAKKSQHRKTYNNEIEHLKQFQRTLNAVRKSLANIPTYMIFDDHDITDDWFLNESWCKRVLTNDLGKRVMQNGVLANLIFQAWGNTPEAFESGQGAALLANATNWTGNAAALATTYTSDGLAHGAGWPKWHFTITGPDVQRNGKTGPAYEVIVLDSRTWRSFPGELSDAPGLINPDSIKQQIGTPASTIELTVVIAPAPVIANPLHESMADFGSGPYIELEHDRESWERQPSAIEGLMAQLAARGAPDASGKRQARIVILSGDVHYGFAARLQYWGDNAYADFGSGNTQAVFAQLTASACKNEDLKTHTLKAAGLGTVRALASRKIFGWNNIPEVKVVHVEPDTRESFQPDIQPWPMRGNPALLVVEKAPAVLCVKPQPDWCRRHDFIGATGDPVTPTDWAAMYVGTTPLRSLLSPLIWPSIEKILQRSVVGVNNFGDIRFQWGVGDNKSVSQTLWFRKECRPGDDNDPVPPIEPLRIFTVPLTLNDTRFPRPTLLPCPPP